MFVTPSSFLPVSLRRVGGVALACSALVLSACGGGDRAAEYQPASIVSFGDENSAFASYQGNLKSANLSTSATLLGLTYTVNRTETSPSLTCTNDGSAAFCASADSVPTFTATSTQYVIADTNYPNTVTRLEVGDAYKRTTATTYFCNVSTIWVQTVAQAFGKGYRDDCTLLANAGAESFAEPGAKVADVVAQINDNQAALKSGVLVTIMAGQNDILSEYRGLGNTPSADDLKAARKRLRDQADILADAIQRVLGTGAKVILALTPDLGESPLAYANSAAGRGVLTALTKSFNDHLYITRLASSSGRQLVGVNATELTANRDNGYVHSTALCDPSPTVALLPDGQQAAADPLNYNLEQLKSCNDSSLVAAGGSLSSYLWADEVRFAPAGHAWIGTLAASRAAEQL